PSSTPRLPASGWAASSSSAAARNTSGNREPSRRRNRQSAARRERGRRIVFKACRTCRAYREAGISPDTLPVVAWRHAREAGATPALHYGGAAAERGGPYRSAARPIAKI